jgi:putative CocE/NonD family hydrolase
MRNYGVRMRTHVKVPMRDGVELSTDIFLPDADGRFPTVLMRTPYVNSVDALVEKGRALASLGYVCVMQDVRGRGDSDGEFYPFVNEASDGFDTQDWIGSEPWSNGRIGMSGGSYDGWVQTSSASLRNPNLRCIAPMVVAPDLFRGKLYRGGALNLPMMGWSQSVAGRTNQVIGYERWRELLRALPLAQADSAAGYDLRYWRDWIDHPTYGSYWEPTNFTSRWEDFEVPALNIGGWFDLFADGTCNTFAGLRERGGSDQARRSRLVMGPWWHGAVWSMSSRQGDAEFGAASMIDVEGEELRWFDHWLRDAENSVPDDAPVRIFVMGVNEWRDEHEWPLARTDWQQWFIHSGGHANTVLGNGTLSRTDPSDEPTDTFVYHPEYPVQTVGGCASFPDIVTAGPYDQRDVEMRGDVLCYTTEPLEQDLEVTGPVKLVLYAATDGPDTDWTGKLVDVSPSGYAMNLCDGIIRARYRDGDTATSLLEQGEVYRYEIDMMVTSNVFRKGHSIRLEISSSNFPRFDRNLNTGHPVGKDSEIRVARQTILHTGQYPTHLLLPVIPA